VLDAILSIPIDNLIENEKDDTRNYQLQLDDIKMEVENLNAIINKAIEPKNNNWL
jgi:hypothetical protein